MLKPQLINQLNYCKRQVAAVGRTTAQVTATAVVKSAGSQPAPQQVLLFGEEVLEGARTHGAEHYSKQSFNPE